MTGESDRQADKVRIHIGWQINESDFFLKSVEFKVWLDEEKGKVSGSTETRLTIEASGARELTTAPLLINSASTN